MSSDILARLVEVWSGRTFIDFLKERLFDPLGMVDTDFYVPESRHDRFAVNYAPDDPMQPMKPGLNVAQDVLVGGYLKPKRFMSGGGGLVSTLPDYAAFIRMLVAEGEFNGERFLKPETVRLMRTNQLPEGVAVQLPNWVMPDTVFGIGLAIKTAPRPGEPAEAIDEFHWGGMAARQPGSADIHPADARVLASVQPRFQTAGLRCGFPVISDDIDVDKLLEDIDQQIEIVAAIAGDNAILTEQLRLLQESREIIVSQELEIGRLAELIDPDDLEDFSTLSTTRGGRYLRQDQPEDDN